MAINGTVTASDPTAYGLVSRGTKEELVLTFGMKAASSVTAGDMVKMTNGYIEKCTAVADVVIGMAKTTVDNSAGLAGAPVSVVIRGIIEQDGLTANGTHTSIKPGIALYLAPAVSSYCAVAQALSISNGSSAVLVGKALDFITQPGSGSQINKVRVLIDFADRAIAWV